MNSIDKSKDASCRKLGLNDEENTVCFDWEDNRNLDKEADKQKWGKEIVFKNIENG